MNANKELLQSLQPLTEEELVYRRFHELRGNPESFHAYMDQMEDYVRERRLLIFDYPFVEHPTLLREEDLYGHLSISRGSSVNVVRHLRYTPVFPHSHTFFTVLYVLRGRCGHTVDGKDLPMERGDVFFLPPVSRRRSKSSMIALY